MDTNSIQFRIRALFVIFAISVFFFQLTHAQEWSFENYIGCSSFRSYEHNLGPNVDLYTPALPAIIRPYPFVPFGIGVKRTKSSFFFRARIHTFQEFFKVTLKSSGTFPGEEYFRVNGMDYSIGAGTHIYARKNKIAISGQLIIHQLWGQPKAGSLLSDFIIPVSLEREIQTFKEVQPHFSLMIEGNAFNGLFIFLSGGSSIGPIGENNLNTYENTYFLNFGLRMKDIRITRENRSTR